MPKLRWTGRGHFSHPGHGLIPSGETIEVDDEDEADELLNHRTGDWEEVEPTAIDALSEPDEDAPDDGDAVGPSDDATDPEESPEASNDDESVPDYETFPREELEDKEYAELRDLAVDSDHPDINGRSSGDEIIEALAEN